MKKDAFHILSDGNLMHQRGQRFRNDILLYLEDKRLPTSAVHFDMRGPYIRLSMDSIILPQDVCDEITQRLEDFELGLTYPPTDEEAAFMVELINRDS